MAEVTEDLAAMITGAVHPVVAVLGLSKKGIWNRVSSVTLEDVCSYLQAVQFGAPAVVVPAGRFRGLYHGCCARADEIFVCDWGGKSVAAFREGVLQRRIGEDGSDPPAGCAVDNDVLFLVYHERHRIGVYPASGGAPMRTFGVDRLDGPLAVAASEGLVYVGHVYGVAKFAEDGTFIARSARDTIDSSCGIAVAGNQVFVATRVLSWTREDRSVAVLCAADLSLERAIGRGAGCTAVAVAFGLVFAIVRGHGSVAVFDAADGCLVTRLDGFGGWYPKAVAVREHDATLIVMAEEKHLGAACVHAVVMT